MNCSMKQCMLYQPTIINGIKEWKHFTAVILVIEYLSHNNSCRHGTVYCFVYRFWGVDTFVSLGGRDWGGCGGSSLSTEEVSLSVDVVDFADDITSQC